MKYGYRHVVAAAFAVAVAVAGCTSHERRIEGTTAGADIDNILVDKSERRMYLRSGEEAVKVYRIAIGSNVEGPKRAEGDRRTPEGRYWIYPARESLNGFNLFMPISYPSKADIVAALESGASVDALGGQIGLHGTGGGATARLHKISDHWTAGCIAVSDPEIEEISRLIMRPVPIRIVP